MASKKYDDAMKILACEDRPKSQQNNTQYDNNKGNGGGGWIAILIVLIIFVGVVFLK